MPRADVAVGVDHPFHRQDPVSHRKILEQRCGSRPSRRRRRLRRGGAAGRDRGNGDGENGGRDKTGRPGHDESFREARLVVAP